MLEIPFLYSHPATGKEFIGRVDDVKFMVRCLAHSDNIALISAPKTGKKTLIDKAMTEFRKAVNTYAECVTVNLLNARNSKDMAAGLADAVISAFASTPAEIRELIKRYFPDTHITFDSRKYQNHKTIVVFEEDKFDERDLRAILEFPFVISANEDRRLIIIMDEFQTLRLLDDNYKVLKMMESVFTEFRSQIQQPSCSFIFTGSEYNAMKDIFLREKWFFRMCECLTPSPFKEEDIVRYIERGFNSNGKVLEREMLEDVCRTLKNNLWYIVHLFSICDHLSKGFIVKIVIDEAFASLIEIHHIRFVSTINDLTSFQVSLLRAVLDGHTRLSSAEVINNYSLSSTANVKRLKDALVKKEIITFDENDVPSVIDPLFEYWLRKYYFEIQ